MLQPQDPVEPAPAVGAGGGSGRGEHRPGSRGHQLGPGTPKARARRRVPGVERSVCTSWTQLFYLFIYFPKTQDPRSPSSSYYYPLLTSAQTLTLVTW